LASEFISAGSKVTLIYGPGTEMPPEGVKVIRVQTSEEMRDALIHEMRQKLDIIILAAAASDYTPEKPSRTKFDSDLLRIVVKLKRIPKMIDDVKKSQRDVFLVGFKAEANVSKKDLIIKAREKLYRSSCDLVIANDIGTKQYKANSDYNNVFVIDETSVANSGWKSKVKIVKFIRDEIEKKFARQL
jgi:phosphopantothenoylcysteine decarboxylase/phosphopantothenate--cysteine ligase